MVLNRVLTKGELHNGAEYLGASRSALSARWDSSTEKFKLMRFKYNYYFIEELPHPDNAQPGEDSFKPFCILAEIHDIFAQGTNSNAQT